MDLEKSGLSVLIDENKRVFNIEGGNMFFFLTSRQTTAPFVCPPMQMFAKWGHMGGNWGRCTPRDLLLDSAKRLTMRGFQTTVLHGRFPGMARYAYVYVKRLDLVLFPGILDPR